MVRTEDDDRIDGLDRDVQSLVDVVAGQPSQQQRALARVDGVSLAVDRAELRVSQRLERVEERLHEVTLLVADVLRRLPG